MSFKSRLTILTGVILLLCSAMCPAQQMTISDFDKLHKPILRPTPGADKQGAVISFSVTEEGFKFKIADEQVASTPSDGALAIVAPKGCAFIEVEHPDYGSLFWKIPVKRLKRKRVYIARLAALNPKSEYSAGKQWAVLNIAPERSIVIVGDTLTVRSITGQVQLYLPLGNYPIQVIAPFHNSVRDTIRLEDKETTKLNYSLEPLYSYISVVGASQKATLAIDGEELPQGVMQSGRLTAGRYRVTLSEKGYKSQSVDIELAERDRKVIEIKLEAGEGNKPIATAPNTTPEQQQKQEQVAEQMTQQQDEQTNIQTDEQQESQQPKAKSSVTLRGFDDDCEILIDRVVVGKGEWQGELEVGNYYFMSRRDGIESQTIYYEVKGDESPEIDLPTPLLYYGKLNVACNIADAKIYIDGTLVGLTPMIIDNLDRNSLHTIEIRKEGYKSERRSVRLVGNDMERVDFELKSEK